MEKIILKQNEKDNVIYLSSKIKLPTTPKEGTIAIGCKGCEGGCAAELCAY